VFDLELLLRLDEDEVWGIVDAKFPSRSSWLFWLCFYGREREQSCVSYLVAKDFEQ